MKLKLICVVIFVAIFSAVEAQEQLAPDDRDFIAKFMKHALDYYKKAIDKSMNKLLEPSKCEKSKSAAQGNVTAAAVPPASEPPTKGVKTPAKPPTEHSAVAPKGNASKKKVKAKPLTGHGKTGAKEKAAEKSAKAPKKSKGASKKTSKGRKKTKGGEKHKRKEANEALKGKKAAKSGRKADEGYRDAIGNEDENHDGEIQEIINEHAIPDVDVDNE